MEAKSLDPDKRNASQHPNILPLDISFYNLLLIHAFVISLGIFLERCWLDVTRKDQLFFIRVFLWPTNYLIASCAYICLYVIVKESGMTVL